MLHGAVLAHALELVQGVEVVLRPLAQQVHQALVGSPQHGLRAHSGRVWRGREPEIALLELLHGALDHKQVPVHLLYVLAQRCDLVFPAHTLLQTRQQPIHEAAMIAEESARKLTETYMGSTGKWHLMGVGVQQQGPQKPFQIEMPRRWPDSQRVSREENVAGTHPREARIGGRAGAEAPGAPGAAPVLLLQEAAAVTVVAAAAAAVRGRGAPPHLAALPLGAARPLPAQRFWLQWHTVTTALLPLLP